MKVGLLLKSSVIPPLRLPTMGVLLKIDSITTLPKGSFQIDGAINTSILLKNELLSAYPKKVMFSELLISLNLLIYLSLALPAIISFQFVSFIDLKLSNINSIPLDSLS